MQLPLSYMLTELNSVVDAIDPNGTNITQTGEHSQGNPLSRDRRHASDSTPTKGSCRGSC